ncbi:MAG TPA: hypothetical protein VFB58_00610 [Chloroflexota bacterium]|nr:hypothetical protein [Chloroflexota bacterium]
MSEERASSLPIRPGMDVYGPDQSEYIGSVVAVERAAGGEIAGAGPRETGSSPDAAEGNPALVHEGGAATSPTPQVEPKRLGEEMGPVSTIDMGNTGPVRQSAAYHYATTAAHGAQVSRFAVRPGRINLGPLTPAFWVPVEEVRSVSMERVVLGRGKRHLAR